VHKGKAQRAQGISKRKILIIVSLVKTLVSLVVKRPNHKENHKVHKARYDYAHVVLIIFKYEKFVLKLEFDSKN